MKKLGKKNPTMIFVVRFFHTLLSILLLIAIGIVYYAGFTDYQSTGVVVALAALITEGILLYLYHGTCPLVFWHRKYGDHKSFYDLFLPKKLAKSVSTTIIVIGAIGVLILLVKLLNS